MAQSFHSEPFILKKLVRLAGIEPTTPWFVAKYSIQLSYIRPRPALYAGFAIWQSLVVDAAARAGHEVVGMCAFLHVESLLPF